MTMRESSIERNSGKKPIFNVKNECQLSLENVTFIENESSASNQASCIASDSKGVIILNDCKFINNRFMGNVYPSYMIYSKGNLNILKASFEENIGDGIYKDKYCILHEVIDLN